MLLYHTDVCSLSCGRVFTHVLELQMDIIAFHRGKENKLCGEFETHNITTSLTYLVDVFSHLNDMNIALQGSEVIF